MPQLLARRYDTQQPVEITWEGKPGEARLTKIIPANTAANSQKLPWVAPGFVDLQVNGFGGIDFNQESLTIEGVEKVCRGLDPFGTTKLLPTCTTAGHDLLFRSMTVMAEAHRKIPAVRRRMPGIHLEGPYIAPDDGPRGAHPREHVRPPSWAEFQKLQDAADGLIKLVTLSPEYPEAIDFIRKAASSGVLVAIGHTQATSEQITAAVDAGARLSTHLGNGAHAQLRRHPNYIWDQLAEDRLTASLIADGHHLSINVLKAMLRAKTTKRAILVSDITGMAGMPVGVYHGPLGSVEVLEGGRLVVAGQRHLLAGAALPISIGVAHLVQNLEVPLTDAIAMVSQQPAAMIGLPINDLNVGDPADLVVFDFPADNDPLSVKDLIIHQTLLGGEVVFKR